MEDKHPLHSLSDDDLLRRLTALLQQSRRTEAELVAHIGEVDERRLYAREASPSMFAYCTDVLRLSEAEAYLRIAAGRATREHPVLLAMLADGRLHLTGLVRLAPHLTPENRDLVLSRAVHRSKRQIDELIAELSPRPDVLPTIRALPSSRRAVDQPPAASVQSWFSERPSVPTSTPSPGLSPHGLAPDGLTPKSSSFSPGLRPDGVAVKHAQTEAGARPATLPARSASIEPLAPGRFKVQFTASAELRAKLERLQALMRALAPTGDLAAIIEDAVTEKLRRLEARRYACTARPRKRQPSGTAGAASDRSGQLPTIRHIPTSRYVPASVRRTVYERDGGRCCYVDAEGRRCPARERLEFHHRHPYGYGGRHDTENIQLMCHTHNAYLAEIDYGRRSDRSHSKPAPETGALSRPSAAAR